MDVTIKNWFKRNLAAVLSRIVTTSKTAAENGTDLSLVTTGEKYAWSNATGGGDVDTYISVVDGKPSITFTQS